MSQSIQNKLSNKVIEKTISATIKKEIAAANIITTTRRGNKELKFLTSKIARYPFNNIEQVQIAGVKLGQHLAEIFQQRGKTNLDGGIIRQVYHQKELFSLAGLSEIEQTSNQVAPSTDLTATNLEKSTEEIEIQSQDEVSDNTTTQTIEEPESKTEEPTSEVQPDNESSLNEEDSSQEVSENSQPTE